MRNATTTYESKHLDPPKLIFPIKEYEVRVSKVKQRMIELELDACLINTPENIYYLTGYHSQGYFEYQTLIISKNTELVLITRFLEIPNWVELSWSKNVVGYGDSDNIIDVTRKVLQNLRLDKGRIGLENNCWYLPRSIQEQLEDSLPSVTWLDCSGLVEQFRAIKSDLEVNYIRKAAKVAEIGMSAGLKSAKIGLSENHVAAEVYRNLILAGGEYTGFAPFVTSGPRVPLAHATWSGRLLGQGDVVFIELAGCIQRYHACLMRCAVLGKLTRRIQSMADACLEALESTISTMRPGIETGIIDEACHKALDATEWGKFFNHRTGYSIGIGFPPSWSEGHIISLKPGGKQVLQQGMVFHIVPTIHIPGETGIAMDETVLITQKGNEVLTQYERYPVVLV
jgi:Xaa-Pro dipeptidase